MVNDSLTVPATLTADQVAELLGVSRDLVYERTARGEIPHRRLGRRVLYSRTRILQWLEEGDE